MSKVKEIFGAFILGTASILAAAFYVPAAKILGVPYVDLDSAIIGVNERLGWK
ncbi:MAG TPA: hypothetical protein VME69_06545 [Methylocella sp.]|nr:hypothetical protein [Methylocella sp.]